MKNCRSVVARFATCNVAVVGDLMLDRYVWGQATRISQEAPVPVVHVQDENSAPGGAANVVRNIRSLGGRAWTFGVIGEDEHGDALLRELGTTGAVVDGVVREPGRPTTVKTRVFAGNQQVVRIDREEDMPVSHSTQRQIVASISKCMAAGAVDAVILEDYAKGLLSHEMVAEIVAVGARNDVLVALDPHAGNAYNVKGLRLMTPNRAEAFALAGCYPQPSRLPIVEDVALLEVGKKLLENWGVSLLLITLGSHGMALFRSAQNVLHIPTKARDVFDVSGAGDTVMSTFVLSLLAGGTAAQAADIANHAAGIVVAEVGTATVGTTELLSELDRG